MCVLSLMSDDLCALDAGRSIMTLMAGKDFVDPEPLLRDMLEEKMREIEDRLPEPRTRTDEQLLKSERRRLTRELRRARRSARWLAPTDEP